MQQLICLHCAHCVIIQLNMVHITLQQTIPLTITNQLYIVLQSYGYLLSYYWTNDDNVRKALGIHKVIYIIETWTSCSQDNPKILMDMVSMHHGPLKGHLDLCKLKGFLCLWNFFFCTGVSRYPTMGKLSPTVIRDENGPSNTEIPDRSKLRK